MHRRVGGLWLHRDFLKLWSGQTISLFGSEITSLALPLTAILVLGATPAQMGILGAVQNAPYLLIGLFVGVWVDRLRRRPLLIGVDLGRAILLGSIPCAALLDRLDLGLLYVVGFIVGILTVLFDVAYQSFLPTLVQRLNLVEGNSKLEMSRSIAQITGPGLAGVLIQVLTAPLAIIIDALSFAISALFFGVIHTPESAPVGKDQRQSIWVETGEGLRVVMRQPLLRTIIGCWSTFGFFTGMQLAVLALYVIRELGIAPAVFGVIFLCGGIGVFLGAAITRQVTHLLGLGPAILIGLFLDGIAGLFFPLAGSLRSIAIPLLAAGQILSGIGLPIFRSNQLSLRQVLTPDRLQGRVNAISQSSVWGIRSIGALAGGFLGQRIGLQQTLLIGAIGVLLATVWVLCSPMRKMREVPVEAVLMA